jgi:hypothetical protein
MANKHKERPPLAQADLEAFWRSLEQGGPDFVGPVGPPMHLWMHNREKQRAWREKVNLAPLPEDRE